jgi:hypothetical protein
MTGKPTRIDLVLIENRAARIKNLTFNVFH